MINSCSNGLTSSLVSLAKHLLVPVIIMPHRLSKYIYTKVGFTLHIYNQMLCCQEYLTIVVNFEGSVTRFNVYIAAAPSVLHLSTRSCELN